MPHQTVDPIFIAGNVILSLQGIISRRLDPLDSAVISIGSIHGGLTDNVIPGDVKITGTIRYFDYQVQQILHKEIENTLSITRALGGDYRLVIEIGYPPMINDFDVFSSIRSTALDLLGSPNVLERRIEMGAEDFGFLSAKVPGAMFSLGCGGNEINKKLHSADFDIDEKCLPIGVAILAETAIRYLRGTYKIGPNS
jgi:amidohydrolase